MKFAEKIEKYFKNIEQYLPWILKGNTLLKLKIHFHTVQELQSSASGFGAIASCLMSLDEFSLLTTINHQPSTKKLLF